MTSPSFNPPVRSAGPVDLRPAAERAFLELPVGTAEERLTHYCGRVWDLLRSCTSHAAGPVDAFLVGLVSLITEGVERGEFATDSPSAAARLLLSTLFARSQWCAAGLAPALAGPCSRVVAETLTMILPAMRRRA